MVGRGYVRVFADSSLKPWCGIRLEADGPASIEVMEADGPRTLRTVDADDFPSS